MLAGRRLVNEERRQLYYEAMVADRVFVVS